MFRSARSRAVIVALAAPLLFGCSDDDGGNNSDAGNSGLQCLSGFQPSESEDTCVYTPLSETTRTACGDIWADCDASGISAPVLDCVGEVDNPPASPPNVTLQGFMEVFSSGPDPTGITVKVFDAADLVGVSRIDDTTVTPLGQVTILEADLLADIAAGEARACFSEKDDVGEHSVECPVPTADCGGSCQDDLSGGDLCYKGTCYDRLRYEGRYSIPNIPTHRPLVIQTIGADGYGDLTWGIMTQVNVYLRTTDAAYDESAGTYDWDANILSRQDWLKIPQTMGLAGGISPGYGAIAGEVHDCTGTRLVGAQVGLYPQSSFFAYFNGNPLDTVPLTARLQHGTNSLSVYAEFELPAGEIEVEAWGLVSGTPTLLGKHSTYVFQDSVTVLSINDGMPTIP